MRSAARSARSARLVTFVAIATLALSACGEDKKDDEKGLTTKPKVEVPSGDPPTTLEKKDISVGTGAEAAAGQKVSVQYVGVAYSTKKQFDASWDRGAEPFNFTLGAGGVIPGWDQGVPGMKVGGRRQLVIPPDLAYGPEGYPPLIGQNETLVFVVDLVSVG